RSATGTAVRIGSAGPAVTLRCARGAGVSAGCAGRAAERGGDDFEGATGRPAGIHAVGSAKAAVAGATAHVGFAACLSWITTPGHTPPQPSPEFWQVAAEQLGVQTQVAPQREFWFPQRAASLEGHCGSVQTSPDWREKSSPNRFLQTSPAGQALCGLVESQLV